MKKQKKFKKYKGFSIAELAIVVTIVAILATIVYVGYSGLQSKARDSSILSDLDTLEGLETNYALRNKTGGLAYYSGNGPSNELGFTPSSGNVIDVVVNGTDYCIRGYNPNSTKNSISNSYTKESRAGVCAVLRPSSAAGGLECPSGFIAVPGSITYGTSDFCVMKYEAKNVGGIPTSQPSSSPWTSISQNSAIAVSSSACSGCHLISEAEWLTIAQNVLQVPSNWSGGAVGSGYIYNGHNDGSPNIWQNASTDDSDGYYATGNAAPSIQRRTLTLSNGSVIWDFSGNVFEWTSGQVTVGQPGLSSQPWIGTREWSALDVVGTLSPNPFPVNTGIAGASSWTSANGIGRVTTNHSDTRLRAFLRSGEFDSYDYNAGVLDLNLSFPTDTGYYGIGFRVAK